MKKRSIAKMVGWCCTPFVFALSSDVGSVVVICLAYLLVIWACVRAMKQRRTYGPTERNEAEEKSHRLLAGSDVYADPAYYWLPGNVYYSGSDETSCCPDNDWTTDIAYSSMAGNLYYHYNDHFGI